jgi:ERCC4-type nuclease
MSSQHKQMEKLSDKTGTRTLYIIEGSKKGKNNKIGKIDISTLDIKLKRIFLRGSSFITSKNQQETAEILTGYAREIMRLVSMGENLIGKPLSPTTALNQYNLELEQLNKKYEHFIKDGKLVEGAQELEQQSNNEILTTVHKKTNGDVMEAMWMSIKNVSEKTYPLISAKYSLKDLICVSFKDFKQLTEDISNLKYINTSMKIGIPRAKAITIIGYSGKIESKKEERDKAIIKMLKQIPTVSEEVAKIIIKYVSLRDICNGEVSSSFLAELERENGRRLGKIGEVVTELFTS